jgi:hypothetical protein
MPRLISEDPWMDRRLLQLLQHYKRVPVGTRYNWTGPHSFVVYVKTPSGWRELTRDGMAKAWGTQGVRPTRSLFRSIFSDVLNLDEDDYESVKRQLHEPGNDVVGLYQKPNLPSYAMVVRLPRGVVVSDLFKSLPVSSRTVNTAEGPLESSSQGPLEGPHELVTMKDLTMEDPSSRAMEFLDRTLKESSLQQDAEEEARDREEELIERADQARAREAELQDELREKEDELQQAEETARERDELQQELREKEDELQQAEETARERDAELQQELRDKEDELQQAEETARERDAELQQELRDKEDELQQAEETARERDELQQELREKEDELQQAEEATRERDELQQALREEEAARQDTFKQALIEAELSLGQQKEQALLNVLQNRAADELLSPEPPPSPPDESFPELPPPPDEFLSPEPPPPDEFSSPEPPPPDEPEPPPFGIPQAPPLPAQYSQNPAGTIETFDLMLANPPPSRPRMFNFQEELREQGQNLKPVTPQIQARKMGQLDALSSKLGDVRRAVNGSSSSSSSSSFQD